jgi:asparagine synthase (glutamine-hydrolysing)
MHWSIESRVPFLTTQFAEFALSLPEHYLLSPNGQTKLILREAMRGITPDLILDRRDKIGFQTPEQEWLRQLRPFMENWLDGLSQIPFIDSPRAKSYVSAVLAGGQPFNWQIWRIVNASRWIQVNFR